MRRWLASARCIICYYHFGEPIEPIPVPKPDEAPPADVEFFCFHNFYVSPEKLDFPYQTLATIPCDRFRGTGSKNRVIVCRRLPATAQGDKQSPRR